MGRWRRCGPRWLLPGSPCCGANEGTRLERPQLGGELPVSSLGGLRPRGHMFGKSPNGGQDVRPSFSDIPLVHPNDHDDAMELLRWKKSIT